jgi:beta-glucosidase
LQEKGIVALEPGPASSQQFEPGSSNLTVEQKVRLLSGADFWATAAEPAVGLQQITMSDGPAGVRGIHWDENDTSLSIPAPTSLGATWDVDLIRQIGSLLASEARRKGVDVVLAPTVNLHRTPFAGRHFECYSEDPLLTGILARSLVAGIQGHGVAACAKHFVANDSETERMTYDVRIDEPTLRQLYLLPFEMLVEAGVWTVMAAYNGVNGRSMSESPMLQRILKEEWGFDGVVVSDWTGIRSTVESASSGIDLAMPGPSQVWGSPLVDAVKTGLVPIEIVDDKVERLIRLAARTGKLDGPEESRAPLGIVDDPAGLLRQAAAAGFVLAKNHRNLLPLDSSAVRKIAVIGPNAAVARVAGGGSARVFPPYSVSPLDGLRTALPDADIGIYVSGPAEPDKITALAGPISIDPASGMPGVRVHFLDRVGRELGSHHRSSGKLLYLPEFDPAIDRDEVATIEVRAQVTAPATGVHQVGFAGAGPFSLALDGEVVLEEVLEPVTRRSNIEQALRPLQATTSAFFEEGRVIDLVLTHTRDPAAAATSLRVLMRPPSPSREELLAEATHAATEADVAIVVVGTSDELESEGADRETLSLPGYQDDLVRSVARANANTIVVVNTGAPVLMPWELEVPVILLTWFPGQEFGNALADVLVGITEPGGRLPTTWWRRPEGLPSVQPKEGVLDYTADSGIGYRREVPDDEVLFPFGHGLGYTDWDYESMVVETSPGETPQSTVSIHNRGGRHGSEVIQLYAYRAENDGIRSKRVLAGFAKVEAEPGETVSAVIQPPLRVFERWDPDSGWVLEPEGWILAAGRSVTDLRLRAEMRVPGSETAVSVTPPAHS